MKHYDSLGISRKHDLKSPPPLRKRRKKQIEVAPELKSNAGKDQITGVSIVSADVNNISADINDECPDTDVLLQEAFGECKPKLQRKEERLNAEVINLDSDNTRSSCDIESRGNSIRIESRDNSIRSYTSSFEIKLDACSWESDVLINEELNLNLGLLKSAKEPDFNIDPLKGSKRKLQYQPLVTDISTANQNVNSKFGFTVISTQTSKDEQDLTESCNAILKRNADSACHVDEQNSDELHKVRALFDVDKSNGDDILHANSLCDVFKSVQNADTCDAVRSNSDDVQRSDSCDDIMIAKESSILNIENEKSDILCSQNCIKVNVIDLVSDDDDDDDDDDDNLDELSDSDRTLSLNESSDCSQVY